MKNNNKNGLESQVLATVFGLLAVAAIDIAGAGESAPAPSQSEISQIMTPPADENILER